MNGHYQKRSSGSQNTPLPMNPTRLGALRSLKFLPNLLKRSFSTKKPAIAALAALFFGLTFSAVIPLLSPPAQAASTIPYKINFQGRLTNAAGNTVADGLYNIKFRIYTASSGGSNVFQEDRIITGTDNRVQVTNGLFSIQFGDITSLSTFDFTQTSLFVEVEMPSSGATCATNGCAVFSGAEIMTPRQPLGSSPYAFNADKLDGVDGTSYARNDAANTFTNGDQLISRTSTTAFSIQNASAVNLFTADTSALKISTGNLESITPGSLTSNVITKIADTGGVGTSSSIAIGLDGFARITYEHLTNHDLMFARCTDANCTSPVITTLESSNFVGDYSSIAIGTDGFARIAYKHFTDSELKFIQCTNADCSTKNTTVLSTVAGNAATPIVLGSDGFARIAYRHNSGTDLKFIQCTNADCSTKNNVIVDSTSTRGSYASLDLDASGFARIAYQDTSNFDLMYAQCTNADCSTKVITTVDTGSNYDTSIKVGSDGFARISYYDSSNTSLKFAQCTNVDCSTNNLTTVDNTDHTGLYTSLGIGSDGFARISYYNSSKHALMYGQCTNADCSAKTLTALDSAGYVGYKTSLALGSDGFARISYYDYFNNSLKYVRLISSNGQEVITGSTLGSSTAGYGELNAKAINLQGGLNINNAGRGSPAIAIAGGGTFIQGKGTDGALLFQISDSELVYTAKGGGGYFEVTDSFGTWASNYLGPALTAEQGGNFDALKVTRYGGTGNYITADTVFTVGNGGATTHRTTTNSTSAFQVQTSTGANVLSASTTTGGVGIGLLADVQNRFQVQNSAVAGTGTISSSGTTVTGNVSTVFTTQLRVGDTIFAGGEARRVAVITNDTTLTVSASFTTNLAAGTTFTFTRPILTMSGTGDVLFENTANSITAFKIQRSNADTLFTADTTNNRLIVGNATASTGTDTTLFVVDSSNTANLPTAVNGGLIYNSQTGKFMVVEDVAGTPTYKTLCNTTDLGCGAGGGSTLQQAYAADVDSADATLALTAIDGNLIFQNPASGGVSSGAVLKVEQLATGAVEGLRIESAGSGNLLTIRDTTATAQDVFKIADGGATTLRNQTDSTSAFKIQNATSGTNVFNVDTTNMRVQVGAIGTSAGQLYVSGQIPSSTTGTISTGTNPYSVYVQGRYSYVANYGADSMTIFDVSNPSSPTQVGTIATGDGPGSVYVQGRYAYVANYLGDSMTIYDVSNPSTPVLAGTVSTGDAPASVYVQGRYAYVANYNSDSMTIYDIANPSSPVLAGTFASTSGGYSIFVQGRYAYVANYFWDDLDIYDVSNPASPTQIGTIATDSNPYSVYVQGRYAYVVNYVGDSMNIFDVSNPSSPVLTGTVATGDAPTSVYVQDRFAYVANYLGDSMNIFDVSNPSSPVLTGTVATGDAPTSVYVQGRYAYVANYNSSNMTIYDIGGAYVQQLEAGGIESGTLTTIGNAAIGGGVSIQGGLNVGGSAHIAGDVSSSGLVKFQANSAAALQVQNTAGNTVLGVDTSANQVLFGKASALTGKLVVYNSANANTVTISVGTTSTSYNLVLPTTAGAANECLKNSATPGTLAFGSCGGGGGGSTRKNYIVPEYPGGILSADGSNNSGSITSNYDGTNIHNYYEWLNSTGTLNDYDVIVRNQIPSEYASGFGTFKIWAYGDSTSTANNDILVTVKDGAGTACASSVSVLPGTAATWTEQSVTLSGCTYAANDLITITVRVISKSSNKVRIGEISYQYTN